MALKKSSFYTLQICVQLIYFVLYLLKTIHCVLEPKI